MKLSKDQFIDQWCHRAMELREDVERHFDFVESDTSRTGWRVVPKNQTQALGDV